MRIAALALLGACTFTPGEPMTPGGGSGSGSDPGGTPGGVDAAPVANRPACDLNDTSLQLCLDFEATPLGLDSSLGQHDATCTHVQTTPRLAEQAVAVDTTSMIHVDHTAALEIADAITYEVWVYPVSPAPPGGFVVLNNSGEYSITLQSDGKARCSIGANHVDSKDPISLGAWTHLACTYDRSHLDIYVQGDASACSSYSTQIATGGVAGTTIGAPFLGAIDNVHVLSRAASRDDICSHAGRSSCSNNCSGSDG